MKLIKKFPRTAFLLVILLALSACGPPVQTIVEGEWYVEVSGNDDSDCRTIATACLTISNTIERAAAGDTIFIGSGSHTLPYSGGGVGIDATVLIRKPITLMGNGAGVTILDGEATRTVVAVWDGSRDDALSDGDVWIRNLTITNGGVSEAFTISGGGVEIIAEHSNVIIMDTHITDNYRVSVSDGGAGVVNSGRLEMYDVVISGNEHVYDPGFYRYAFNTGGGINNYGEIVISRAIISGNTSDGEGGGLANYGTAHLFAVTIDDNHSERRAGGILNEGYMEIHTSTISNNGGGGVLTSGLLLEQDGEVSTEIVNSTISGNDGIGLQVGAVTLVDFVTIADNRVGLEIVGTTADDTLYISNSIIAHNTPYDTGNQVHGLLPGPSNTVLFYQYTTFFGVWADGRNRDSEDYPLLDRLADNGGPTMTHALFPGSSAIDRIECTGVDQRNHARPYGDGCDAGAYEFDLDDAERLSLESSETLEFATVTPTPELAPSATAIRNASCRKGTDAAFEVLDFLYEGQKAPLIGRQADNNWFYLELPDDLGRCWIFAENLELFGPVSDLPLYTSPELPPVDDGDEDDPGGDDGGGNDGGGGGSAPDAPSNVSHQCSGGSTEFTVSWKDNSGNEDGFRILRDGSQVGSVGPNVTQFVYDPAGSGPFTITVEAFTGNGIGKASEGNVGCLP